MNSSKNKILFRCDAAYIPEIGSGHLYRCLTIAKLLKKKFKLSNQNILFIIKVSKKFGSDVFGKDEILTDLLGEMK